MARAGEPGHALYVPAQQGGGRVDNPEHYHVLYAAESAVGAFGEAFGNKSRWRAEMFRSQRHPGAVRCMVRFEAAGAVLNLDDARVLARRRLRPSDIATPERSVTQRWALAAFADGSWDGLRWWSVRDSRWSIVGLWSAELSIEDVTPLTLDHPAAVEAAEMMQRAY